MTLIGRLTFVDWEIPHNPRPLLHANRLIFYTYINIASILSMGQVTAPLVDYYAENGVLESFHGTMSDIIYPQVKEWLEEKLY